MTGLVLIRSGGPLLIPLGLFPVLLLIVALVPSTATWPDTASFRYLPHGLFCLAILLGAFFRQSRVAFMSLLLIITLLIVRHAEAGVFNIAQAQTAVALAAIYVPSFALILYHVRERGLFTVHGAIRFGIVCSAALVLLLLPMISWGWTEPGTGRILFRVVSPALQLPLIGLLIFALCIPAFLVRVPQESPVLGPLFAIACAYVFMALNSISSLWNPARAQIVLGLFMSGSALTLIVAVLESVWRSAHFDELTDLPGRRAMHYHLAQLSGPYIVAMVDIDHFKKVNDTWGHDTGDQVLRFIASQLKNFQHGSAYRHGGEEFVLVCPRGSFGEIVDALDELRESIAGRPFAVRAKTRPKHSPGNVAKIRNKGPDETITVTVSIGVAMHDQDRPVPLDVLAAADKALYQAKKQGRNRVRTAR